MSDVALAVTPELPLFAPPPGLVSTPAVQSGGGVCLWCGNQTKMSLRTGKPNKYCSESKCRNARYRSKNREKVRQFSREYRRRNNERINASCRTDEYRKRARLKYWKNPEASREANRKRSKTQRYIETRRKYCRNKIAELKRLAYDLLGNICSRCGESRIPVLSIDHINGDGAIHRKSLNGSTIKFYKDVIRDGKVRFQILCMNCQWMKRHERKECNNIKPRPDCSERG